jgi:hypothetical protein
MMLYGGNELEVCDSILLEIGIMDRDKERIRTGNVLK